MRVLPYCLTLSLLLGWGDHKYGYGLWTMYDVYVKPRPDNVWIMQDGFYSAIGASEKLYRIPPPRCIEVCVVIQCAVGTSPSRAECKLNVKILSLLIFFCNILLKYRSLCSGIDIHCNTAPSVLLVAALTLRPDPALHQTPHQSDSTSCFWAKNLCI